MTDEELSKETIRLAKQDKRDNIWMFLAYTSYLIAAMMLISVPLDFIISNINHTGIPEFYWLGFIAIPFYVAGKACFWVLKRHANARRINYEEVRKRTMKPIIEDTIVCYGSDYMKGSYLKIKTVYKSDLIKQEKPRTKKNKQNLVK